MHLARALKHRTEPRKHYGVLTGKFVDVLHALLWLIHDGKTGQCNPAYATIADKAGCAPSTVGEAIRVLELVGILSWCNRIHRVRFRERDLFGYWATTWRVLRTSNAYVFHDPKLGEQQGRPSNTEFRCRPLDSSKKKSGARLIGARIIQDEASRLPLVPTEGSASAPQREHGIADRARLSPAERAALVGRMDMGTATKADWLDWERELDARLHQKDMLSR
jgi:hypothetical protein